MMMNYHYFLPHLIVLLLLSILHYHLIFLNLYVENIFTKYYFYYYHFNCRLLGRLNSLDHYIFTLLIVLYLKDQVFKFDIFLKFLRRIYHIMLFLLYQIFVIFVTLTVQTKILTFKIMYLMLLI